MQDPASESASSEGPAQKTHEDGEAGGFRGRQPSANPPPGSRARGSGPPEVLLFFFFFPPECSLVFLAAFSS